MSAADVMKRENRRFSVINEVAKALDEIAALESDARKQAELIIAEAEAKAAQIVADALNESKTMMDEVKVRIVALEDIARHKATMAVAQSDTAELKPIVFGEVIPSADAEELPRY